jgi:hypothetical protein
VRVLVDDLTVVDESQLERPGLTALAELTMRCLRTLRHQRPDRALALFDRWRELLRRVDRYDAPPESPPLGPSAIGAVGWYALGVTDLAA